MELRSASESCQGDQRGEVSVEVGDTQKDAERASCPGEIREEEDVEQAVAVKGNEVPVGCTVQNDLRVAAELELGQGSGWQVIYPEGSLNLAEHFDETLQIFVRLRDDAKVCGMCAPVQGSTLMLSADFGDFGDQATELIRKEEDEAEQESRLRKQRHQEINQQLNEEVSQSIRWRQKVILISISVCLLIPLGAMVACTVAAFSVATELQAVGLIVALLGLVNCTGCGFVGMASAHSGHVRKAVQAAHPELQEFEDTGVKAAESDRGDWRRITSRSCICCIAVVVATCMMTVIAASDGWLFLNIHMAVLLIPGLLMTHCCLYWPSVLLLGCGFRSRFTALLLKPPKRLLDAAVNTTHDHTIVFEGNVLPGRETVCSWPGKYATAWDTLVAGARKDDISAAVVFLPEGSQHFGLHDPIPSEEGLQDLHGDCWCTPLYGERKPWGCRWWSKWIANIELTVAQQSTVVVYYFNGRRGEGKVKDFTTAGDEHLRREAIELRKKTFLESEVFRNTLEAGLKHLSEEKGPDSSSPYSREVHRLFLAWLPKEDRQFLVSSEGLGNSQKAEVAWLERKGYRYFEKEVSELESSSPKAIGQAATP